MVCPGFLTVAVAQALLPVPLHGRHRRWASRCIAVQLTPTSPIDRAGGFFYCFASPGLNGDQSGRSGVGIISSMNSPENGSATTVAASSPPQLLRALGWWEATAIVIGIMIGTGIFIVPAEITRSMGTRDAALSVWAVTGLLSLFGALSFAELAAMMPQAGGQYVYLREAYGPLTGYLCGWSFFIAAQTGGISVLAVGFAEYANEFLPLTPWEQKAAAAAVDCGVDSD